MRGRNADRPPRAFTFFSLLCALAGTGSVFAPWIAFTSSLALQPVKAAVEDQIGIMNVIGLVRGRMKVEGILDGTVGTVLHYADAIFGGVEDALQGAVDSVSGSILAALAALTVVAALGLITACICLAGKSRTAVAVSSFLCGGVDVAVWGMFLFFCHARNQDVLTIVNYVLGIGGASVDEVQVAHVGTGGWISFGAGLLMIIITVLMLSVMRTGQGMQERRMPRNYRQKDRAPQSFTQDDRGRQGGFCPSCGAPDNGDRFCSRCGRRLR